MAYGQLDPKQSCKIATGIDIDLSSPDAVIGGVIMELQDRVLVMFQANKTQNGIYVWNGIGCPMTRSADADGSAIGEVWAGLFTYIEEGFYGGTGFVLDGDAVFPKSIGWDDLEFLHFSSVGVLANTDGEQLEVKEVKEVKEVVIMPTVLDKEYENGCI